MNHETFVMLTRIETKLGAVSGQLEQLAAMIPSLVNLISTTGAQTVQELDDLQAQVTIINNVQDSAIVLLNGLAERLAAAAADPAQVLAISQTLSAKSAELAAAVAANTPSA